MPTTANLALRYPSLSDAPNIPQDVQNLAADVETYFEAYATYTPTFYTNTSVTPTAISSGSVVVAYAREQKWGKRVHCMGSATINTTTTNGISVSLPHNAAQRFFCIGQIYIQGSGTLHTDVFGNAFVVQTSAPFSSAVVVGNTNGYRNIQTSGQTLHWNFQYEAA